MTEFKRLSCQDAHGIITSNEATVVDIRDEQSFAAGRISGSHTWKIPRWLHSLPMPIRIGQPLSVVITGIPARVRQRGWHRRGLMMSTVSMAGLPSGRSFILRTAKPDQWSNSAPGNRFNFAHPAFFASTRYPATDRVCSLPPSACPPSRSLHWRAG